MVRQKHIVHIIMENMVLVANNIKDFNRIQWPVLSMCKARVWLMLVIHKIGCSGIIFFKNDFSRQSAWRGFDGQLSAIVALKRAKVDAKKYTYGIEWYQYELLVWLEYESYIIKETKIDTWTEQGTLIDFFKFFFNRRNLRILFKLTQLLNNTNKPKFSNTYTWKL